MNFTIFPHELFLFLGSGSNPGFHTAFSSHVFLGSSNLRQFPGFLLLLSWSRHFWGVVASRRWNITSNPLSVGYTQWLPSKEDSKERREKRVMSQWRNLTNVISDRSLTSTVICILDVMKMAPHFCGFLFKLHNPTLIMRKISDESQLRDILQNT